MASHFWCANLHGMMCVLIYVCFFVRVAHVINYFTQNEKQSKKALYIVFVLCVRKYNMMGWRWMVFLINIVCMDNLLLFNTLRYIFCSRSILRAYLNCTKWVNHCYMPNGIQMKLVWLMCNVKCKICQHLAFCYLHIVRKY